MQKIKHLYGRAGFGLSPAEWEKRKEWPVSRAVDELFREAGHGKNLAPATEENDFSMSDLADKEARAAKMKEDRRLVALQSIDWVKRMADQRESALLERMSLFWHGHFACTTRQSKLAIGQLGTIRQHALGNFRALVLAIARDPSMIRFLNNQQNKKQTPNENFARELMELFTIGRGHYTEKDIKEAARAFTGWSSNLQGEFVFRALQHDYGSKTFFGKTGNFDGDDIIDMILEKRETADFITRKIYRYFVNEQEDPAIIQELSRQFYDSGYDIGQLMRRIFLSDWFYNPMNIGRRIKSPAELMAGILRSLSVDFKNELALVFVQRALGQVLFNPPNVAGWPGGKSWIDNSTLMLRLNLPAYLLTSKEVNMRAKDEPEAAMRGAAVKKLMATVDLRPLENWLAGKSEAETFAAMQTYLLPVAPRLDQKALNFLGRAKNRSEYIRLAALGLMSLPEYQLC